MNVISKHEAAVLSQIEGADYYPYRVINEHGADRIVEWLDNLGWPTGKENVSAWIADAENQPADEVAVLEIPARATKSGRPETLYLEQECFDWRLDGEVPLAVYVHGHLLASGPQTLAEVVRYCQEQYPAEVTKADVIAALQSLPAVSYDAEYDAYEISTN